MSISGYITIAEFMTSNYFCLFEQCCSLSGIALSGLVNEMIIACTSEIENYLGYSMWLQPRRDVFRGRDNFTQILDYFPITTITGFTYRTKAENYGLNTGHHQVPYGTSTGTVQDYAIIDSRKGMIESNNSFCRDYWYTVDYNAGYTEIPEDVKTALKILIAQRSQQIDTGNLANPDVSNQSFKFDTTQYTFGASNLIKNIVIKDVRDIYNMPATVTRLLDRYKYSSFN